jgi:hypothetical protein
MSQELVIVNQQTALANLAAVAEANENLRLIKFVKGKWYVGDDEQPAGREFYAHVGELGQGWIKFKDNKVVDKKVGIVAKGFALPLREDLDDYDMAAWETDVNGAPKDPWTHQYFLPLEDVETGELLTFVTGSQGGNAAIGRLTRQYVRNAFKGTPIVQLATDSYKHKQFGKVETPEFKVTSWSGGNAAVSEDLPF